MLELSVVIVILNLLSIYYCYYYCLLLRLLLLLLVGEWGWGVEGKQVGSMDEEPQVRGCYNITFICTPTNQETVSVLEKTQANKTFRT